MERQLGRLEPVAKIVVNSTAVGSVPRQGFYEPGDRIVVCENDVWVACEFVEAGEPSEGIAVPDSRAVSGSYRRDVAWIRLASDGKVVARRYELLRPGHDD